MTGLRKPLAPADGLTSEKGGTRDFWRQRVTSILGLPLTLAAIIIFVSSLRVDHAKVVTRFHHPMVAIVLLLTILNFCVHMRLGMKAIIEDYVHEQRAKALLLMANTGFVFATGIGGALAVLKIAMGG
ncbi:succinate dehydrogenase, hydrophobic membrane anchor protein [Methylocystis sp. IM3]|uniref:succinate dehydrogenase, hydrophobic membrane anchor protein n=1 Tax=unclassified Methylocystis TaxID=2625913 RepID=UPI0030F6037F